MKKVLTIIISMALGISVLSLARAGVSDHVTEIQISKSVEYYHVNRYNVDVAVLCDSSVSNATVQFPDGVTLNLVNDGTGWYDVQRDFPNEQALADLPAGNYVFTVIYTDFTSDTTTVFYGEPGGGDIPLITQEPVLINPLPDKNNVSTPVTFAWQACMDSNILSIGLEWEPTSGYGLFGEVNIVDITTTNYGPIQLSQNVKYELLLSFNRGYYDKNSDGIEYVIDADSEQKFYFHTDAGTDLDIKANGQDGPIVVTLGDQVSIEVSLDPGDNVGQNADWWIAATTPFAPPGDWCTYVYPTGWLLGINLCAQAPLFTFSPFEVLNIVLPSGEYTFYFVVDSPDGSLAGPWFGMDSVEVQVQ